MLPSVIEQINATALVRCLRAFLYAAPPAEFFNLSFLLCRSSCWISAPDFSACVWERFISLRFKAVSSLSVIISMLVHLPRGSRTPLKGCNHISFSACWHLCVAHTEGQGAECGLQCLLTHRSSDPLMVLPLGELDVKLRQQALGCTPFSEGVCHWKWSVCVCEGLKKCWDNCKKNGTEYFEI